MFDSYFKIFEFFFLHFFNLKDCLIFFLYKSDSYLKKKSQSTTAIAIYSIKTAKYHIPYYTHCGELCWKFTDYIKYFKLYDSYHITDNHIQVSMIP